jgi:antitoxin (DNA-binding transcriptional repressor) of toxin-antitoxin stability system
MTHSEERVAAETGRVLLALYRAGLEVKVSPDGISGRAAARIVAGPSARKRSDGPRIATGTGDSPLAAICAAVERLNERSGAIVVALD